MSLDTDAGAKPPAPLPLQFVNIEITPVTGGRFSVAMQATLLDEQEFELIGEQLADTYVETLEQALAVIRQNVTALVPQEMA